MWHIQIYLTCHTAIQREPQKLYGFIGEAHWCSNVSVDTKMQWAPQLLCYIRWILAYLAVAARGYLPPGANAYVAAPPTHPVAHLQVCRNLKGSFQMYIFKNVQILAYFFTVGPKYQYIFSYPKVPRRKGPDLARYSPGPSHQIGNWYSYGCKETVVWTVNSTLSWGVYNCLTQWNLGLCWSIVTAKKTEKVPIHKKPPNPRS